MPADADTKPWSVQGYPGLVWTFPTEERSLHRLTDPTCPCAVQVRRDPCQHTAGIVVIFDHNRMLGED